jgi:hypothetical protein
MTAASMQRQIDTIDALNNYDLIREEKLQLQNQVKDQATTIDRKNLLIQEGLAREKNLYITLKRRDQKAQALAEKKIDEWRLNDKPKEVEAAVAREVASYPYCSKSTKMLIDQMVQRRVEDDHQKSLYGVWDAFDKFVLHAPGARVEEGKSNPAVYGIPVINVGTTSSSVSKTDTQTTKTDKKGENRGYIIL